MPQKIAAKDVFLFGVGRYRISGAGKQGLPLLVIHGGPGAAHDYPEPPAALASGRPVIFYDQLG